jgi:hypothetical protein
LPWGGQAAGPQQLAEAIVAAIEDPTLRSVAGLHPGSECTEVFLHPVAENLELTLDRRGGIICSAKTSTCGPGYHAWVVELLERAGKNLGLAWTVSGEEFGDETGYWTERSHEKLQDEMVEWLHEVAKLVLQKTAAEEFTDLMINMPLEFPTPKDDSHHFAITPMGPRTREWFELVAQSHSDARRLAPAFFPWWNRGTDGDFWRGLGLVLAWGNLTWTIPQDDEQTASYRLAQTAFRRAQQAGASGLPLEEMAEIDALLTADDDTPLPLPDRHPTRIGYRRRKVERPLTGNWHVTLPGYYYWQEEDDGRMKVYWYGDRTLRGSSITVERRDGRAADPLELIGEIEPPTDPTGETFDERHSDPPRWAVLERAEDDDAAEYWSLSGRTGAPGELCFVTISFYDEADRDWALATWRSVVHRPSDEAK